MSKKLTIAERDFLAQVITDKIVEKKQQALNQAVESNPAYIALQKLVEHANSIIVQIEKDYENLKQQLCEELGMSGGYSDSPLSGCGISTMSINVGSVCSYTVRKKVNEKIMYEQVLLGGVGEDFVDKVVEQFN
jgi:hypothetical protein